MSAIVRRCRHRRRCVASVAGAAAAALSLVATGVQALPAAANGSVPSKPAIFHDGVWYLRTTLTSGPANTTFSYGRTGDIPVMGDWDGDGDDTVGVVRQTQRGADTVYTWFLRNSNSSGSNTVPAFVFGAPTFVAVDQLGTIPVAGDWDGDGDDTPGIMAFGPDVNDRITWTLLRSASTGSPADTLVYGRGRGYAVTGDWDGDGDDTVGFRSGRTWFLRNSITSGVADLTFDYGGRSLELPVPGDWDGDGDYTPAVLRNNPPGEEGGFPRWLFRNSNTAGVADGQFLFGGSGQTESPPIEVVPRLSWR